MPPISAKLSDVTAVGLFGRPLLSQGKSFALAPPVFQHPNSEMKYTPSRPDWSLEAVDSFRLLEEPLEDFCAFTKPKAMPESHSLVVLGFDHPNFEELAQVLAKRHLAFVERSAIYHAEPAEWVELFALARRG